MYIFLFLIDNQEGPRYNSCRDAGVAQLVEYKLPKLGVAGSRPVARSIFHPSAQHAYILKTPLASARAEYPSHHAVPVRSDLHSSW